MNALLSHLLIDIFFIMIDILFIAIYPQKTEYAFDPFSGFYSSGVVKIMNERSQAVSHCE